MKHNLFIALALLTTMCACSNKKTNDAAEMVEAGADSLQAAVEGVAEPIDTVAQDWEDADIPMVIYDVPVYDDNYIVKSHRLRHIYGDEDDIALYKPLAKNYIKMVSGSKLIDIKYAGEQEGPSIGNYISGEYGDCMSGLNYTFKGKIDDGGWAFTEGYLQNHEIVSLKYPKAKAPKSVIDTLEARYGLKVKSSATCGVSTDGKLSIYSIQMRPKGKKCLGMRVVAVDDQLYTYEDWAEDYNDQSAWHVDDGGEYYPFAVEAVTKGPKGYNIFYYEGAPESSTNALLMLRNGKFVNRGFACYYNYIDYCPPTDEEEIEEDMGEVDAAAAEASVSAEYTD